MNVSLSYAAGFYTRPFEDFLIEAGAAGFRQVQLIPDQAPNLYSDFSVDRTARLRNALQAANISASVHNVFYDINPVSMVPEISEFARTVTRKVMKFGAAIGAQSITVHPGYMYPGWRNDEKQNARFWELASSSLRSIVEMGLEHNLRVNFENGSYQLSSLKSETRTPFHVGISVEEFSRMLDCAGPNANACFDYGKAVASGIEPEAFIHSFASRIREIQVSSPDALGHCVQLLKAAKIDLKQVSFVYEGRNQDHFTKIAVYGV